MFVLVYLIIALVGLIYWMFKRRYNYWNDRGFLTASTSIPFGTIKGVGISISPAERAMQFYNEFKGKTLAVGGFAFTAPELIPIDLELLKNILIRDFSSFNDRGMFYNKKDQPVTANLLTLEGQDWRDKRVKLSPIFTSGKMKSMFDIVNSIGDRFVKVINKDLEQTNELEVKNLSGKYTADVIGNCAFGIDCQCLEDPNSEFLRNGQKAFDFTAIDFMRIVFTGAFPNLGRKLKLGFLPDEPCRFFLKTFIETLEHREKSNIQRNDFVSLLLGLKDSFTPEELAAESFLVYLAGFETSSTLMMFTMYELALIPEIQDRLRAEIVEGLKGNDGKLTYDLLFGFEYLDMVIKESMRKYPPLPVLSRLCTKEYKIPGTELIIPKGTGIEISTFSIHRDPEYYPEPMKFDPERFTPEEVKARNPITFMPFGEGPRNCIGLRFGLMQAKLAIVKIIQNFKISPSAKTPITIKFLPSSPFLAPVGGMHLTFKKIK